VKKLTAEKIAVQQSKVRILKRIFEPPDKVNLIQNIFTSTAENRI